MPSTYATNSGIELIRNGEQSGTWGTTTNTNLNIVDRLTNGVGTINLGSSGASHTLTTSDGALSDGQFKTPVSLVICSSSVILINPQYPPSVVAPFASLPTAQSITLINI